MTWYYNSRTGSVFHPLIGIIGKGYSGTDVGRDNPEAENLREVGAIPRGKWRIGLAYTHNKLGVLCMNLAPIGHNAFGRSSFRIHGDNKKNDASTGCIILNRKIRQMISDSNDTSLIVYG